MPVASRGCEPSCAEYPIRRIASGIGHKACSTDRVNTNDPIGAARIGETDRDGGLGKRQLRDQTSCIAAFGIPLSSVAEIHVYRGTGTIDDVPPTVVNFLRHLYAKGNALGPAIMAFLHQGRRIESGEAIYLVVVEGIPPDTQQVKAFIAQYRD